MRIETLEIDIQHKATGAQQAVDDLVSSLENLRDVLKDLKTNFPKLTIGGGNIGGISKETGEAIGAIKELNGTMGNGLSDVQNYQSQLSDASKKTEDVGKKMDKTAQQGGKFFASLKRIAMYRLLRTVLKELVQGLKEGMQNLYQYDKLLGGSFSKSMDLLATDALYLKNSLGALAGEVLPSIMPILDIIVEQVVEAFNAVNYLLARLKGAETWTKARKVTKEYSDTLGEAADNMSKLTAGFDELNILSDDKKSGSGIADASEMFETVSTKEVIPDFKKILDLVTEIGAVIGAWKIGAAFSKTALKSLGQTLAAGLTPEALGIGAVIVTLAVAFVWDYTNDEDFKNDIDKTTSEILENSQKFVAKLNKIFGTDFPDIWAAATAAVGGFFNWLEPFFSFAYKMLARSLIGLENLFTDLATIIKGVFTGDWDMVLGGWLKLCKDVLYDVYLVFRNVFTFIYDIVEKTLNLFGSSLDDVIPGFSKTLSELDKRVQRWYNGEKTNTQGGAGTDYIAGGPVDYEVTKEKAAFKGALGFIGEQISDFAEYVKNLPKLALIFGLAGTKKIYDGVTAKASGGYVNSGQMFIARENGLPELIGNFGGRSGVMNNEQIIEAVSQGVYNAVSSAMGSGAQNVNVYIDGKQVNAAVQNAQRRNGAVIGTGGLVYGR